MGENEKSWERPWSSDEIRKNSVNWTLAGDIGLLNHLREFSHHLISRTHEMEKIVDGLVHQTKETSAKVDNVVNDFQMLSNLKFVENRVYDEEIVDSPVESKENVQPKSKEERETEMLTRVKQALNLGLNVLEQAFERIEVDESSDSEDEDLSQGRTELKPKDLYEHRPLPFVIGSEAFQNDDFAGLKYMIDDESMFEESSIQDDNMISQSEDEDSETETDEDLDFDEKEPVHNQYEPPLPKEETIKSPHFETNHVKKLSESEGSDLFGDEDENSSLSSIDAQTNEEPTPKKHSIRQEGGEEPKLKNAFLEELGSKLKIPPKPTVPEKTVDKIPSSQEKVASRKNTAVDNKIEQQKDDDDLFGNDDSLFSDSESPFAKSDGLFTNKKFSKSSIKDELSDELFGTTEKISPVKKMESNAKAVTVKKTEKRDSLFDDDDDDDQDLFGSFSSKTSSTISQPKKTTATSTKVNPSPSLESVTKTSSPSSSTKGSTKSPSIKQKSEDSLFGSDSDDDLFSGTKITQSKKSFDFSAANDNDDDLFSSLNSKSNKVTKPEEKATIPNSESNKIPSLFDDNDDFDLFGSLSKSKTETKEEKKPIISSIPSTKADMSLFEDSTDLFAPAPKEIPPKAKEIMKTETKRDVSSPKNVTAITKASSESSSELKMENSKTEAKKNVSSPKNVTVITKASSENSSELKMENPMEPITDILKVEKDEIGFDKPIESTSTLSALNKDRAKIQVKRRKPTRKGRQALQNMNNEQNETGKLETGTKKEILPSEEKNSNSNDLFSAVKSSPEQSTTASQGPFTHKSREREKQNLMSQLIAEAATSRVGKKNSNLNIPNDDSDLFSKDSETSDKSKLDSEDFSFMSPTSLKKSDLFGTDLSTKAETDANIFSSEDDLFSEKPTTFHNDKLNNKSPFGLDDDDDIFKATTKDVISHDSDDIFGGDSGDDIFADIGDEKYGMFPKSKLEDDSDDDDIFSNLKQTTKPSSTTTEAKSVTKPDVKKKPQDIFEDPLGGLSLND